MINPFQFDPKVSHTAGAIYLKWPSINETQLTD